MKLYEVSNKYIKAINFVKNLSEDQVEDYSEKIESMFKSIEATAKDKILAIAKILKNNELRQVAIDKEVKRLQAMKKTVKNKENSLKSYVLSQMDLLNIKNVDDDILPVSKRKTSSVNVYDESVLCNSFWREEIKRSPDKKAIKEAIKSGEDVDGACIKTGFRVKIG